MSTQINDTQAVNKMVSFSSTLYGIAQKHAQQKGITIQEYIRYLILRDDEKGQEPLYMVDEEIEKGIAQSLEDYKNKQGTLVKNKKELQKMLDIGGHTGKHKVYQ